MKHGLVVHFEDEPNILAVIDLGLPVVSDDRHSVVGQASDLASAFDVLEKISNQEIEANAVLLDGNLSYGGEGSDARAIRARIGELGLSVRTIGMAGKPMAELGVEVDADLQKPISIVRLAEILDELPEPTPEEHRIAS
jgi:hypothetical protein